MTKQKLTNSSIIHWCQLGFDSSNCCSSCRFLGTTCSRGSIAAPDIRKSKWLNKEWTKPSWGIYHPWLPMKTSGILESLILRNNHECGIRRMLHHLQAPQLTMTHHIKHFIKTFQSLQSFTNQEADLLPILTMSILLHLLPYCLSQFICRCPSVSEAADILLPK